MIEFLVKSKHYLSQLKANIDQRVEDFGAPYFAFGIFGLLNYPIYYLIWRYGTQESYESLFLRSTATILCVFLLLNRYWSNKLKTWLPIYWYITVFFCLPFFFFYMFFMNNAADVWLMSTSTIFFWLALVVDWGSYVILLTLGIFLAWVCFLFSGTHFYAPHYIGYLAQYAGSIIIGTTFAYTREKIEKERVQTIKAISSGIAHELRTPFASISVGADTLKNMLPELIDGYKIAGDAKLIQTKIRPGRLEMAREIPQHLQTEADSALLVIDLLLANAHQAKLKQSDQVFSITNCITEALRRYPFKGKQRDQVHWEGGPDFSLQGDQELITYVLFNFMKNALYFTAKAGKGEIFIRLRRDEDSQYLEFEDTGLGIPKKDVPHVFDPFYTKNTHHGSGIGLSFCKMVSEAFGGQIGCESEESVYTRFTLRFPKNALKNKDKAKTP